MDLDKEFKYILSLKEFINKSKSKLDKGEYTKLEFHLNEPIKKDILDDDFDSFDDSPGITFNPNLDNTKIFNSLKQHKLIAEKESVVQTRTIVDNSLADHYKDLLDHSLTKFTELETVLLA
jgi:hypothetical protein